MAGRGRPRKDSVGAEIEKTYETSKIGLTTVDAWQGEAQPKVLTNDYLEKFYKQDELIRQCVDATVYALIGSGYHFSPKFGNKVNKAQLTVIEKFFEDPNSEDDMDDLVCDIGMDILTYGTGYLEIEGIGKIRERAAFNEYFRSLKSNTKVNVDEINIPYKLIKLCSRYMKAYVNDSGIVYKYMQDTGNTRRKSVTLLPPQVVPFKMPSPLDGIEGLSPSATLSNAIGSDLYATEYNAGFFENNATPRLHFNLKDATEEELKRFKGVAVKELKGQPHKNIITRGDVAITPIGITNKDMEFSYYQTHLRERIFGTYRMQPFILGLSGGGAPESQIALFKFLAVDPLRRIIASRINKKIIRRLFPGTDLRFKFNPIDRLDMITQSKIDASDLEHFVKNINQVRAERGLDPAPWGDDLLIPWSSAKDAVLPVGKKTPKSKEEEPEIDEEEDES